VKILIVKMSSLGDVIHALPALADLKKAKPEIEIDWVVEEGFSDIPMQHPLVDNVIPVAIRRWRKHWIRSLVAGEVGQFVSALRASDYDLIIDSQGLIKSAIVAAIARGPVGGFARKSAREPIAVSAYAQSLEVDLKLHAVERQRRLFAGLLGYEVKGPTDYGFISGGFDRDAQARNTIMLLHGTTWESKLWPASSWRALSKILLEAGHNVVIPSGNEIERKRAESIAENTQAVLLDPMGLKEMMTMIATCKGVVSVDSGLGHLACALDIPLVALYGATDPSLTGIVGPRQSVIVSDHLSCIPCKERNCRYGLGDNSSKIYPPCFEQSTPESVWQALQSQISKVVSA
jgi:heptosyltransferase-1